MKTLSAYTIGLFLLIIFSFSFKGKNFDKMNTPLLGTHWGVVELNGQPVATNASSKPMYLEFKTDSTLTGNGGCNAISGSFNTYGKDGISFSDMVRTNVSCDGIINENKFLNALAKSDHYKITNDTLMLQNQMLDLVKLIAEKK